MKNCTAYRKIKNVYKGEEYGGDPAYYSYMRRVPTNIFKTTHCLRAFKTYIGSTKFNHFGSP